MHRNESRRTTSKRTPRGGGRVAFESILRREDAVSYFEALVTAFKRGSITIRHGEEAVSLRPSDHVEVRVKASSSGGVEWVSFEVAWREPERPDLEIDPD